MNTIGRLLLDEALPQEMRGKYDTLDKKGMQKLFQELATNHPEKYRETLKRLSDVSRDAVYTTGGYSFGLRHMKQAQSARQINSRLDQEVERILLDPKLDEKAKEEKVVLLTGKASKEMEEAVYQESTQEDNPLGLQVKSGTRGNKMNLKSLRGGDSLYVDHRDRVIPIPVTHSYSQGLTPAEYFAGSFGARHGVIAVKMATADAGFFGKILAQVAHRLVVTGTDHDKPPEGIRGVPVDTNDSDNEGSLLAQAIGPYKRNTPLTARILNDLHNQGIDRILVRSPMVGGPQDGGVYARDVGIRERGKLAPMGDMVGIAASQALSEVISQMQLGQKHSGGVAGSTRGATGFKLLSQLVQVPKHFPGGASHARVDGTVQGIEAAPAGGQYVTVGNEKHYIPMDATVTVKKGATIEAGDVLSDGIPNPAEIVNHKGIGEGRRYFSHLFKKSMQDSGASAHRRNVELLARGLINHVRLHEEHGEYVPGDVIPYNILEHSYQPRPGHELVDPRRGMGKYLERPVLHYSIGTQLKPSMVKELQEFKVPNVIVHKDPPPFAPEMVRGMASISNDPDWMTRMLGSNLEKGLLGSVHRGAKSDDMGTSYVPGLARGVDFGTKGKIMDWHKTPEQVFSP